MSTVATKERPIIMSGESVRAILEDRKTQTRRVCKPQPIEDQKWDGGWKLVTAKATTAIEALRRGMYPETCPYGVPGDRLWVREGWAPFVRGDGGEGWVELVRWRADEAEYPVPPEHSADWDRLSGKGYHWRSPIYMPRWACRLLLEVTEVRVERVQEIDHVGIQREGVLPARIAGGELRVLAAKFFRPTWDALNAKRGHDWETSPWVWVLSFRRLEP